MNKTITSKISVLLLLTLFALFSMKSHAQAFDASKLGTYKIKVSAANNGTSQDLFLTQSSTTDNVTFEPEITSGNNDSQLFIFNTHPSTDDLSITSKIADRGPLQTLNHDSSSAPYIGCKKGTTAGNIGDLDKWWFASSNTQLRLEEKGWGSNRKISWYQNDTKTSGVNVRINASNNITLDFVFVATLSITDFDTSSVFISNPVNDKLSIEGLTANIKQVSVYSLLGKQILSKEVEKQSTLNFDVSNLSSGMYLVKMQGDKDSFVKKIVKQ